MNTARMLALVGLIAMMVGCPTTTTDPPYTGGYTENSQLVTVVGSAMADHTIPLPDLQGSDGDYGYVVLSLVPKTTDPATGQILSYEKESIGVLLASRRDDGKVAVLKQPFIQFDAILSPMLGDERDIRFYGGAADAPQVASGSNTQIQIATEVIGLLALARLMGAFVDGHDHNTITTYNNVSYPYYGWPYPAYPCYYGYGGGCGGPMLPDSYYAWHGYGSVPPYGGWWYGYYKSADLAKAIPDIPELPLDSVAPSGAITVTENMARIVIRYGYRLPDKSAVQKNLTILPDNDGDGFTNVDEWNEGTDPNNPNSFPTSVPNVVGMLLSLATTTLTDAHLLVGNLVPQHNALPVGTVLAQSPVAGTTVQSGTRVNLAVSDGTGSAGITTTVPNVIGLGLTPAGNAIIAAQLVVGTVTRQQNQATAGTVLSQSPTSGTTVNIGSAVNLVVSDGPPVTQPSVTITSPPSGTTYTLGTNGLDVVVKVLATGMSADGPYTLYVRDAQLHTATVTDVPLGVELTIDFHLSVRGMGYFTAYLQDSKGQAFEDHVPYVVQ